MTIIGPDTWGPHGWKFIHYVTLGYPENPTKSDKQHYESFFILLKHILPCSICANHYKETYEQMPLNDTILNNRELLIRWGIDLHNVVNKMKNKTVVPYEKARRMIEDDMICKNKMVEHFANTEESKPISNMFVLLILLGMFVTIAIIYKK
jgi:hypothetical protein